MQDFGTKTDNSPPPGGQLSAAEFNNLATENENAVLRSGQALSGASATQLAGSLFLHSVKSASFQDSGVANSYVATPISGLNGVLLPATYAEMDGARITFVTSNANSGNSTLNIGQTTGTLLGSKKILTLAGAEIPSGTITTGMYVELQYNSTLDGGAGAWTIVNATTFQDFLNTTRIDVSSATTVNLTSSAPNTRHINITGTTTINAFTVEVGKCYFVRFDAVLTLTNSASIVTQRGANITTASGDTCVIRATAANVVEVMFYATGIPQALGYAQTWQNVTGSRALSVTYTNTTGRPIFVVFEALGSTTSSLIISITIDGTHIILNNPYTVVSGQRSSVYAIVPGGSTYLFSATNATINKILELR